MNKLLLTNGKIVDPKPGSRQKQNILLADGKIADRGAKLQDSEAEKIDLQGKLVLPGLIDMHVHLREPGQEHKETIATGTQAAVEGGFTTVAAMPNTEPVVDKQALVKSVYETAVEQAAAHVYQVGAITKESKGEELAEIGRMKKAGIVGMSDDGKSVMNAEVMRLALQYSKDFDLPVIAHCEDDNLAGSGVVNEGYYSTITGLEPIPASAEVGMVARDLCLAEETDSRLHIAHISTKEAVELVRKAKQRGVRVTCEATPHHFTLTHEAITSFDSDTKVNPPLRSPEDVAAIKEGLQDGTIDVIATDHAPHAEEEKDVEYNYAPFGISGLETAVGLVITELVEPGILSLEEAAAKLTCNPAEILNLNCGRLEEGAPADITILDQNQTWAVDPTEFASKGQNTPFTGFELKGKPLLTIVSGEIKYLSSELKKEKNK